ncbi:epidermal differentiation-specific protein-like [Pseudorasbora parva]|uniref:epidermal differentiation-specific protein-like n=1 Tax=Pseudorasbora parva TaxID=51549 RepID=UPI00351F5A31
MNKIIIYSNECFEGRSAEFSNNIHNLLENGFNDTIRSIKVIGVPWVAYCDANFSGRCQVFEEGEYPSLEEKGKFSSLQMINANLANPEITLFEHKNFQGRSVTLRNETNLHQIGFGDAASSHKVRGGVWVLYEHINRRGAQLVSFPGTEFPNYVPLQFNDVASHARPLHPRH